MNSASIPGAAQSENRHRHALRRTIASALFSVGRRLAADDRSGIELDAPALVFAPHPDDEVLGCGGTIAMKAAAGAKVAVVIMTDGRTSHAGLIDGEVLAETRRKEALQASLTLGLRPDDYIFLDFEDQRLAAHAVAAQRQVAALLERFDPQQVFVPHRRDRLDDHVATFEIVTAAMQSHGRRIVCFEYPVWLWNTWPWTSEPLRTRNPALDATRILSDIAAVAIGCRTRIDVRSVLDRKREALEAYASQTERRDNDPRWPILADVADGTFVERFMNGVEVFRRTAIGR
jgi:LmbE family N-acetylglucosaminyl deacetylase